MGYNVRVMYIAKSLKRIVDDARTGNQHLAIPDAFRKSCAAGGEAILNLLRQQALDGKLDDILSFKVAVECLDRAYGKVTQHVDASISLPDNPDDQRGRMIELLTIAGVQVLPDSSPPRGGGYDNIPLSSTIISDETDFEQSESLSTTSALDDIADIDLEEESFE